MERRAIIWRWRKPQGYYGSLKHDSRCRSSCDLSANAKASPLSFHRAHLSLRVQRQVKIMKTISSVKTAPLSPRVVTHWRRFSTGLWRVPQGDIAAAYSADTFPKVRVFTYEGRLFTNCGCHFSKWFHAEADCYPLIAADEYQGAKNVPYSYQGREAAYKGRVFKLGAKMIFAASEPTIEEWLHLCRVLYADGGYFASHCTYGEFLANRFDPGSENGRIARLKELAEYGAGRMPQTQEAMRRLLALESEYANQPKQIDLAL
jgi:hypothetical protein